MEEFTREERGGEELYGFITDDERAMFDDLYEAERWIDYLLDPNAGSERASENFDRTTSALNMFGLHLTEYVLENYDGEGLEDADDLEEDLRNLEMFGYSDEIRAYAGRVREKLGETV
ncbi:hypothetical protein ACK3SF_01250 [Candidatus Nanosalina sp. VS9-1]|uniref:hypothetical protein n=1 Tax=Candidatus Nanosalina sp. VS9-1 TaxID=3388566 RepID=UPI0039E078AB